MTNNEKKAYELLITVMRIETRGRVSVLCAQVYARAAIREELKGEVLRVQILYVLNNLNGWQGVLARRTKAKLKKLVKKL